ncbi:ABC transporter permease [Paenibacillus silvisoli]|uniref:ABC transporter permease n=1 Tax=Paenibacillus silvisoli TaxID=3110539 RepID=UPI0028063394|nr:ABC transporter permease subunit [Paenibacillus silvisoli]
MQHATTGQKKWLIRIKQQKQLIAMTVPLVVLVIVFHYLPLWGWIMAFQKYSLVKGISGSPFVGFDKFADLFRDDRFYQVLRNTLVMGLLNLITGFFGAILFALLLNEIRFSLFKRTIQTIAYIPHFVSWVVIANIFTMILSPDGGTMNVILEKLGLVESPIYFLAQEEWFWVIHTAASLWKELGWSSIIYLAVLAGVNTELYEAAEMDGASRYRKMWHISVPSLMPTAFVLLVLSLGWIIQSGYESQFLLGNSVVIDYSEVLDLYALNYSFQIGDYSYGAAISIFKSIVSITLVVAVNFLSGKLGQGKVI